ncbi:hypothetical protein J8I29_20455 [Labrys sp. LIt4]|uniref:hypothetical protein n=1 Tax=Labrys sp. LIt4 TaxID=2821355 RepID=UPI001AE05248|nr:hypothetical protein [Labrys sp. LIt4]MBP0581711.1 hypothetical protein [Labrys sp. LIt4]
MIADAQGLKAHSGFKAARNLFARRYGAVLKANLPVIHLATDEIRLIVGAYVLSRHFAASPNDPAAGVTVADVQTFCTVHALAGHNRIGAILNLLRQAGYLRQVKDLRDKRIKRLEVTRAGLTIARQIITPYLQALAQLQQVEHAVRRVEIDDAFFGALARYCSNYFLTHGTLVDLVPEMRLFMARDAGFEILLKLIATEMPGEILKDRTVHFHYGAVADCFGVSRVHVRRLLEDAAEEGYVTLHAPGGRAIEIHASLFELVDNFIALQMALLLQAVVHAGGKG